MSDNIAGHSRVSTSNSTSTALGGGAVFTGSAEEIDEFAMITVFAYSDVASATNGLSMEFSTDGTNWDRKKTITVPAGGKGTVHTLTVITKYFRIVYTNGGSAQSDFRLQVRYHAHQAKHLTSTMDQTITDRDDVELVRSVIMGATTGGTYSNVGISQDDNALKVSIDQPTSAFGEVTVAEHDPQVQVDFVYSINDNFLTTDVTNGTVTQSNGMAVCSTSAAASSHATMSSRRFITYKPGQGVLMRFTALFTTGVAGSTQHAGGFDANNGVGFGYNGATFGLFRRSGGSDTWVAQSSWNVDVMDGTGPSGVTLDPTKGNVFSVQFQYLGFGALKYYIEEPTTGHLVLVHTIAYANANTVPSLGNPSFPMAIEARNTTNDTDMVVKSGSLSGFVAGPKRLLGPRIGLDNDKAGVGTSFTNILTIRNRSTFQGVTNRVPVVIAALSCGVDGAKISKFRAILNATLGGSPSYTDIDTNDSVVEYDTAGTTATGGTIVYDTALSKSGSISVQALPVDIELLPGDSLTLAVATTAASTTDASCAATWIEDF